MDLVTDFKTIIHKNNLECIQMLEKTFCDVNLEKNNEFYYEVNKFYTGIAIWIVNLKENEGVEPKKILLDNILLNYCSILYSIVLGDIKVINFLYRNVIESLVRYLTSQLETQNLEQAFKDISNIVHTQKEKEAIRVYVSRIKHIYDDTCLYIHTDTTKIDNNLVNLVNYQNNSLDINLDKCKKDFTKMNTSMIGLFNIVYKELFCKMKGNAQAYLAEIMPLEENIRIKDATSK